MDKRDIPSPGEFYRHFKGNMYQIIAIATDTESREKLVIYQALYGDYGIYARTLSMFLSPVDRSKYPLVTSKWRFERVEINKSTSAEVETQPPVADKKTPIASNPVTPVEPANEQTPSKPHFDMLDADELFNQFLDTDDFSEKRMILRAAAPKLTRRMVNTIAMSLDLVPEEKDLDEDIRRIDEYISLRIHFEGRTKM